MAYDSKEGMMPGDSKQVDAAAYAAKALLGKNVQVHAGSFAGSDPLCGDQVPAGNPDSPSYSRTRSIPGTK